MMTGWYAERTPDRSAKAMIAVTLLALLLVAAMPVALLAAVVMMMLGYVVGGLALFGGSVLAAAIAVALAGMNGMRHLRKLLSGDSFRVVRLDGEHRCRRARGSGTTPTLCSWTAASTPKFADLALPRGAAIAGCPVATPLPGGQKVRLTQHARMSAIAMPIRMRRATVSRVTAEAAGSYPSPLWSPTPIAGDGLYGHGRSIAPGPARGAPPGLLRDQQIILVGLDEQFHEHRVHDALPGPAAESSAH